ncbi:HEL027Cp [Eremothecium sinecaudum]|uniref:HEL027Cp n=1 Tax=Eremothecium sinecaudum TaxID=45286 RepID=A0A109UZL3_9SACH|nr:HEL027Cp [Eremothecium sinecaudum]AMD21253.1 HEL027Cp [Eremothecium sinecaudum]
MDFERFLLFGDSITEMAFKSKIAGEDHPDEFTVGAGLTDVYARKMDIVLRGFSGYNSRWALKLLPRILRSERKIAIAYVFFGTNDAAIGGTQSVPLDEYKHNMSKLVEMLQEVDVKVILVSPALHDAENPEMLAEEDSRSNENNKLYRDALHEVGDKYDTGFVDLYSAFQRVGCTKWQELLSDGIHFTGKGYKVFFDELLSVIADKYPEYHPDNMPRICPDWTEVLADGSNL